MCCRQDEAGAGTKSMLSEAACWRQWQRSVEALHAAADTPSVASMHTGPRPHSLFFDWLHPYLSRFWHVYACMHQPWSMAVTARSTTPPASSRTGEKFLSSLSESLQAAQKEPRCQAARRFVGHRSLLPVRIPCCPQAVARAQPCGWVNGKCTAQHPPAQLTWTPPPAAVGRPRCQPPALGPAATRW